jgi:Zn-dependent protease with chaperone function
MGGRIAGSVVVARISPGYEIELGQEVLDQLELTFEDSPKDEAWLQALLDRVTSGLPPADRNRYDWRVLLIHNPFPNAAAVPGGTVLVTSGLLDQLTESEEVTAVLAHEVAHITHRHGLRSLIRILGPYYALQVFTLDRQGFLRAVGGAALIVSRQFYSRKQELEADETALDLLRQAQVDPRSLARGLARLREPVAYSPSIEPPRFLLSHPPDHERITRLEGLWARRPATGPFAPLPGRPAQ